MTAPNVETPPDTWNQLLCDIANGLTGRPVIDRAASIRGDAPLGEATRILLGIWCRYNGRVSGGSFRQRDGGFGISGDRHEAFLSHVCGAIPERQRAVLEDMEGYPEHADLVYQRIIELGNKASGELPRIGGMAIGGGMGRAMFHGMCQYLVDLSDVAKAVRAAGTRE
jgi:hypothetical protein